MAELKKKNNRITTWILGFLLLVCVVSCFFYGQPIPKPGDLKMGNRVFFVGKDPALNFTFEYSSREWSPRESQGRTEKYSVVYLRGPVDVEKRFATLMEVVVKPLGKEGTASELRDVFLKRITAWPKFKLIRKETMDVGGKKAFSATYESEVRLPIESLDAKPAMVREQAVFIISKDKSYRLSFHALADQWDNTFPAFERLLRTFQFWD